MVGIVCFLSTRYSQFSYKYISFLEKNNIPYEFIFWNREGDYKGGNSNWISYDEELNSFQPFYKKILSFFKFAIFLRKIIKKKKYEKLIVLISQTAIPLVDILLFKYKNNFIYDYRDVTFENNSFYKFLVNKLVKNSFITAISSNGFLKYIKHKNKCILSHNTRDFELFGNEFKKDERKIKVTYWGMVRQLEFNYKVCDLFANDNRFELAYHGAGYHKELEEYCIKKGYTNIKITGKYELNDIKKFIDETDIVLNLYENDRQQEPAITVKFYDSIQYGIPMLVTKGSYMDSILQKYYLGFSFNVFEKDALDDLYQNYISFDYDKYNLNRKKIKVEIDTDDKIFNDTLEKYVYGK